jgi:3-oxoadipate enol-lactonase
MPTLKIAPDLDMYYEINDYTDPWTSPETILMLHGNAESSLAWYGWVPILARRYRLVRPDMRGYGMSTPMPRDFPWTLDRLIADYVCLMDALEIERFHLVGAKIGGTIARAFAARHPTRMRSLTVVGSPPATRSPADPRIPGLVQEFEDKGVEHWARRTLAARMGAQFPAEGTEWWIKFMGRTAVSSQVGFMACIAFADISADIPKITCPTLAITTEGNVHASVDETRAWQQTIPGSELLVLPSDSHHIAAAESKRCAQATLEFVTLNSGG